MTEKRDRVSPPEKLAMAKLGHLAREIVTAIHRLDRGGGNVALGNLFQREAEFVTAFHQAYPEVSLERETDKI